MDFRPVANIQEDEKYSQKQQKDDDVDGMSSVERGEGRIDRGEERHKEMMERILISL